MDNEEFLKYITDDSIDKKTKLKRVEKYLKEREIELPEGCCVCIPESNQGLLILGTSKLTGEGHKLLREQIKVLGGGTSIRGRAFCSGTFFRS